jgi:tetratricopeptide (TPR) repeat protein
MLQLHESDGIRSEEIEELLARLDFQTDLFGPCHPNTVDVVQRLATALARRGDFGRAAGLLDRALDFTSVALENEHPLRIALLGTLGELMFENGQLDQAGEILREVADCCVRRFGVNHASSLAAKGSLAAALFDLGREEEASSLEREAFESAQIHLGKTHSVTCVLAWNRSLMFERRQDPGSARQVVVNDLAWLLAEEPSSLEADQNAVRAMLAERLNWNGAAAC